MVEDRMFGGLRWLKVGSVGLLQGWDGGMAGVEGCGMAGGMARGVRWLEVGGVRSVGWCEG